MSEYDLNNPQSDVESYLANMDGILAPLPLPPESNVEKYLAHIVGVQGVELPHKPDSRVEAYLEKLALDPPQPVTPILIEKQITNNGVYSASDDNADGYSKVTVEVPDPVLDELVATVNGEYNPTHDGYSKVTVQVPDPALETLSVTENGEYTPTAYGYSRVTVSVQPPANSYQLKSITTPTSLATFEASEMPMPSLKVSVEAKQASGTPSPSNPLPISGWDEAIVTDTDDVDNPTVTQTTTISLGQTVYGGELDVVNGTSGNKLTDVLQTITSVIRNNGTSYYVIPTQGAAKSENFTTVISDKLPTASNPSAVGVYINNVGAIRINTPDSYESASEMMQAYGGEINVRYELATPTTFTTQPTPIKSLNGTNNLSVDCGEILEGEYFKAL